jgi:hypothetical protein
MQRTTIEGSKYTCLSYEWGTGEGGDWIEINRKLHYVRQNLLDFLQVARKNHHSSPLWIDALCIDQDNYTERSHQVQQMGSIYSHAQEVLVWLGNDSATAKIFADLSHQQVRVASRIPVESQGSSSGFDWSRLDASGKQISTNTY